MKTTELRMNRRVLLCKKRFITVTSTATGLILTLYPSNRRLLD
jgi:hypothetical protein